MGNTFGKIFNLTTFGESHGTAIGGIIDGCPSGLDINFKLRCIIITVHIDITYAL